MVDDGNNRTIETNAVLSELPPRHIYEDLTTQTILDQKARGKSIGVSILTLEGEKRGAQTRWVGGYSAVSTIDDRELLFFGHKGDESFVGARIIADKVTASALLVDAGVPTPQTSAVTTTADAVRFAEEVGTPIVIKPRFGMKGHGVSVDLVTVHDIEVAYREAEKYGEVIAEQQVQDAIEYRCFATQDQCVSVVRRMLPWISGDGRSTIQQLIDRKSSVRSEVPSTWGMPIPVDETLRHHLAGQNLSLESVLPDGKNVIVRNVGGLSSGGEPYEVFDQVPRVVKDTAASAVNAIPGLSWAGVDIMVTPDDKAYVLEINSDAAICAGRYPYYGNPRPLDEIVYSQRLSAPARALGVEPELVSASGESPLPLVALAFDGQKPLSELFYRYLESNGWSLTRVGPKLVSAQRTPSSPKTWFSGLATAKDSEIVHRTVRRHRSVRTLLGYHSVLRPKGRIVHSLRELVSFMGENSGEVMVTPHHAHWATGRGYLLRNLDEARVRAQGIKGSYVVQSYPSGYRAKVVASPNQAVAVIASSMADPETLASAERIAVAAIRSVPELRWGCVSVVCRTTRDGGVATLVEGISVDPLISYNDLLVAGDVEAIWRTVLGEPATTS